MLQPNARAVIRALLLIAAIALAGLAGMKLSPKVDSEHSLPLALLAIPASILAIVVSLSLSPRRSVYGALSTILLPIIAFFVTTIMYPVFQGAREASTRTSCFTNMAMLGKAIAIYAGDSDGRFPPTNKWRTLIEQGYVMPGLRCKSSTAPWTYAMNDQVSSKNSSEIGETYGVVLLFEAEAYEPDAAGGSEGFVERHFGTGVVCFCDGHAKSMTRMMLTQVDLFRIHPN